MNHVSSEDVPPFAYGHVISVYFQIDLICIVLFGCTLRFRPNVTMTDDGWP